MLNLTNNGSKEKDLDLMDKESKEKQKGKGKGLSSPAMAIAWRLNYDNSEAILGKNKREVVPSEEVANGGRLRGIFSSVTLFIYVFLNIL
jgi:hypothetical protein